MLLLFCFSDLLLLAVALIYYAYINAFIFFLCALNDVKHMHAKEFIEL